MHASCLMLTILTAKMFIIFIAIEAIALSLFHDNSQVLFSNRAYTYTIV